jgi:hypothetical protein
MLCFVISLSTSPKIELHDLDHTSIRTDNGAGDPSTIRATKEAYDIGDIFRKSSLRTQTLFCQNVLVHCFSHCRGHFADHVCLCESHRDRVGSGALHEFQLWIGTEFVCPSASKSFKRRLESRIEGS